MADDWLFPTFLERTVAAATAHPSVGMVCALAIDGSSIVNDGFPYPGQFRAGREVARLALLGLGGRQFFGTPTTLLFRANLVRCKAKFYNEDSLLADFESALELTTLTDFSFLHEVLAFVRRHDESITSTVALRYDIAAPNDVYLIDKFGPAVLEGAELADTRNRIVKSYYRALARNFLLMRERKYWDMHRESFRKVKLAFNPLLFGRALLLELLSFVSQPRMALELVRERLRMTRGTSS
jgi:hypothetical protein